MASTRLVSRASPGRDDREQRLGRGREHGIGADQLPDPRGELLAAGPAELEAGLAQQRPQAVLHVAHLVQHQPARRQQGAAGRALHVHRPEPAGADDLREAARVVAVGLVRHRAHGRLGPPGLEAHRRQARRDQALVQPGGQRARLQPDPLQDEPQALEERDQGLRLARDACLPHHRPCLVDHADGGLFQRHVQASKVLHGCSSSMLVADAPGPRSTILGGAATPGREPQSLHLFH
jgi:hypothetical protein